MVALICVAAVSYLIAESVAAVAEVVDFGVVSPDIVVADVVTIAAGVFGKKSLRETKMIVLRLSSRILLCIL